MSDIDQRVLWNSKHAAGEHAFYLSEKGGPFARTLGEDLTEKSRILDLGTGVGGDALYFAEEGHDVVAVDFSDEVMRQNLETLNHPNIHLVLADIKNSLPFDKNSFDVVYAHLSLHYFDDETTQWIFCEINRVLESEGVFAFACKTPQDSEYGRGTEIEPNYYISDNGHRRHFFTYTYVRVLTRGLFTVDSVKEVSEENREKSAAFLRVITRKM